MEIRKQPGYVWKHEISEEDLALINDLAKTALSPDQLYTFAVRLCDNEVDRDWERFDRPALDSLSRLFVDGAVPGGLRYGGGGCVLVFEGIRVYAPQREKQRPDPGDRGRH